ncbi:MAG: FHA domain-containing protein [Anaerolineales bacterium]|nr:FHA domain-containing protein [Anaerolineales bacterium]
MTGELERLDVVEGRGCLVANLNIIPLNKKTTTIGRKLENDFVINDLTVSRVHAKICREDGIYVIYDLNSSGGTFINNAKVQRQPLRSGDVILLGKFPIMFVYADVDEQFDSMSTGMLT